MEYFPIMHSSAKKKRETDRNEQRDKERELEKGILGVHTITMSCKAEYLHDI